MGVVTLSINRALGDRAGVIDRIKIAEKFAKRIHIDIADGKFTFNKTWNDPQSFMNFKTPLETEVHLMVEEPENHIDAWIAAGARRIIAHFETIYDQRYRILQFNPDEIFRILIEKCEDGGCELMLSSNPETKVSDMELYLPLFSSFQVLAVNPGLPGQSFLPYSLEKIREIRRRFPEAKIEVDGGVNLETIKLCAEAGADEFVSASSIFNSDDPKSAYEELLDAIRT